MLKIGFAGLPSCGKTSTSRVLASALRLEKDYTNVALCEEYAREYIAKCGKVSNLFEQCFVTEKQMKMEWEKIYGNAEVLITDSPVQLGFYYTLQYIKDLSAECDSIAVNELYRSISEHCYRFKYDIIFYLPPILTPKKDGVRPDYQLDKKWRAEQEPILKNVFSIFPVVKFVEIKSKSLSDRVDECLTYIPKRG